MSCRDKPTTEQPKQAVKPGRNQTRQGRTDPIPTGQPVSFSRESTTQPLTPSTQHHNTTPRAHKMHIETCHTAVGSGSPHRTAPTRSKGEPRKELKDSGCKSENR